LDLAQHFGVAPRVRPGPVLLGKQDIFDRQQQWAVDKREGLRLPLR